MASLMDLSNEIADAVEKIAPAVVCVDGGGRTTVSGFHWKDGYLFAADHGVRTDESAPVVLQDRTVVQAKLVGRDPAIDLALLHTKEADLPSLSLGDLDGVRPGHLLVAVGRGRETGVNVAFGALSSHGGPWRTWRGGDVERRLRLDLGLHSALSGAPVSSVRGEWIGMATLAMSKSAAIAIDSVTLIRSAEQLREHGRIRRGYLGIGLQPVGLPDHLVSSIGLGQSSAVIVLSVETASPAEKAGLLVGDLLLALGNTRVEDIADVQSALRSAPLNRPIRATLLRGGKSMDAEITLGDRT